MTILPNAVLTTITGPGAPDPYGDAGPGAVLWDGRAEGYLKRMNRTVLNGGQQVKIKTDVFFLQRIAGAPLLEVAGADWEATTVTIEDRRDLSAVVTRTFRVTAMENRAAGLTVDSIRLELEGA